MGLREAHEKWFKNVVARKAMWKRMIRKSKSLDAFVKGVARFIGVSPSSVRGSLPVKNWSDFQSNVDAYLDDFISGIKSAYEAKKWPEKYKAAFTGGRA